jgi:enoyl-CoA hydratase
MEEQDFCTIDITRRGRILTLAINNGRRLNAIEDRLHEELARIFRFAANDPESDVVVLTGTGRAFCAGGDFDWFQQMIDEPAGFERIAVDAKEIVFSLLDLEKPIIAKVNGPAAGLGATIALKQLAHSIMDASIAYEISTNVTHDHQEAVRAFKEKRTPEFTGR